MSNLAVVSYDSGVDPRVVGAVPGRPDDCIYLEFGAVSKLDGPASRRDDARLEHDSVAPQPACARADQCVARSCSLTDSRVDALVDQSSFREPPEQVAPEQLLRKGRLPRPDCESDVARCREL